MCKVKKAGRVGRERTERKLFTLYLLLFLLISAGFAIGFAPSSKNVYFTNNQGEDYFTFSNPTGETYTCSMELNNSQVGATYSEGNPFTTSETSFQIIATYTVPSGFIPNTVKMVARCTKGAGGQQSIVNEFNRQLGFLLQPTTTTIPTITTTIPPTTTTVPPTTTTTIRPSTTTTTIGSPFPTTTTNQPSTTTTTPLSTTTSSTTTTVPTTTTTSIFYAPSFRPITTSVQSSTTSVPSTTIPTTTTIQLMSPPEEVPEIDIKAIGVGIVVLIAGAILIGAFSAI